MKTTRLFASAAMFAAGAALLVLAGCGGSSNSAGEQSTTTATTTTATGGGTLQVNVSTTDVQSIDPAIDYENTGWAILDATCLKLVNYPDKSGLPGTIVIPEAATALPAVSSDGKAYTFTIRKGFKFNTGEEVTAQTFAHVIDRDLSPALQSPSVTFLSDVVGADAVVNKKATHASGVTVNGDKLTVKLTRVAPDFVARMAMNFFCAVPLKLPATPQETHMSSAGPYYIASRTPNRLIVVKSNPHYAGARPHHVDQMSITVNTNQNQSLLQMKSGQADYDLGPLPPASISGLAQQYGVNKSQFFVHPANIVYYAALNTRRLDLDTRKAINYAVDRPALARQAGALAGTPTNQILPPTVRGYRKLHLYPVNGPDIAKAKQLMHGRKLTLNLYTTNDTVGEQQGQVFVNDLAGIGITVKVKAMPFALLNRATGDPNEPYDIVVNGWFADYPDPVDFINTLLDGNNIHAQNNVNVPLMDVPALNTRMRQASQLSGPPRYEAYGKLDDDIMREQAPWASMYNGNVREFISPRVGCYLYQPAYGVMDLATACLE
jgi:peptide/nickel transport system substrate-binding protein